MGMMGRPTTADRVRGRSRGIARGLAARRPTRSVIDERPANSTITVMAASCAPHLR